jgi:hypothetical protein
MGLPFHELGTKRNSYISSTSNLKSFEMTEVGCGIVQIFLCMSERGQRGQGLLTVEMLGLTCPLRCGQSHCE